MMVRVGSASESMHRLLDIKVFFAGALYTLIFFYFQSFVDWFVL